MIHGRMMIPIVIAIIYLFIVALIYVKLKQWFSHRKSWKVVKGVFWVNVGLIIVGILLVLLRFQIPTNIPKFIINWFVGFSFALLVSNLIFAILLLADSIIGIPIFAFGKLTGKSESTAKFNAGRRKFVQTTSTVVAGLPFVSMLYGITFGKYNYQVRNVVLKFPDLPDAFNGFKIAQISDIHSGSFDSKESVLKGVRMVNDQKADLIAFTGDLVNSQSREIVPFLDIFKQLDAPHGVISTKGNHDYGIYRNWPTQEDHIADQQEMQDHHKTLGFDLLNNSNRIIEKDGEQMSIVGVENWGLPPFPQEGDLDKALEGTEKSPFTILLSHDPSHWDEVVLKHQRHVHLTLAGHTHGMQFGVEIPGIKWSPVQYRYPRWAGLYQEKDQYLYVNRGFGFIGFPGRVGIMPEITVFKLEKA
ncbi:MAG: phosphoesterase [Crocinitomicaceae bacterium]|nr:phosphoesterase [Crocinitomicaceae bacterium]|tara:strand:- start:53792 stop:55042 length:1251 start_codon:yes stop_codon:yes gene_type:complete